jgi:hypothetical protein
VCAQLSGKLRGLEARREELAAEEPDRREPLSDEDLALLVAQVREVIDGGDPPTRKALLQSLVEEIRVVSRSEIYPSFLSPAVRPPQGSVPPGGLEPPTRCLEGSPVHRREFAPPSLGAASRHGLRPVVAAVDPPDPD